MLYFQIIRPSRLDLHNTYRSADWVESIFTFRREIMSRKHIYYVVKKTIFLFCVCVMKYLVRLDVFLNYFPILGSLIIIQNQQNFVTIVFIIHYGLTSV